MLPLVCGLLLAGRAGAEPTAKGAKAAFDLAIGGKSERLGPDRLDALVHKVAVPGVRGEVWPLRDLLAKKAPGKTVASITVEGGRGDRYTIDADEWKGGHLFYVRLNMRGLIKFEGADDGGKRFGDVPDVKRIDVKLN
jgi:hypothetical protein